jgi:dynein intermediate chain, cytosolic
MFDKSKLLTLNRRIFDENLTANRGVRAIDFSAFHPELVAVSYDLNKEAPMAPDSIIVVWNTRFKTESPE